jgi:hypothetical protein
MNQTVRKKENEMKRFALAAALIIASAPAFAFSFDMNLPTLVFPSDATAAVLSTSGK